MEIIAENSHLTRVRFKDRSRVSQLVWSKTNNTVPIEKSSVIDKLENDRKILDAYYGVVNLRKSFHKTNEEQDKDSTEIPKTDWEQIRKDIVKASSPDWSKLERFLGSGLISTVASNIDDVASFAFGNALAYGLSLYIPESLALESPAFFIYPGIWTYTQYRYLKSCQGSMHISYELLRDYGLSNSGGAHIAYEYAKRLTEDPRFLKMITKFTTKENFERKVHHIGYWANNSQKEILWLLYGVGLPYLAENVPDISQYLASIGIQTDEANLDAAGWTVLIGANISGELYQKIQEFVLREGQKRASSKRVQQHN